MRLFVAVNLAPDQKTALEAALAPLRRSALPVRWVDAAAVHLTLKFLGEVPEARVPSLAGALGGAAAGMAVFGVPAHGLGAFPSLRRPRVIWLGLDGEEPLRALQAKVEAALRPLGFPPEGRPFSPHLTLGRARQGVGSREFAALPDLVERFRFESVLDVRSIDLMRSHLSREGARYERIVAAPLEGQG